MSTQATARVVPDTRVKMGRVIRTVLAARGLDEKDLAHTAGISTRRMSECINGHRPFRPEEVDDMAQALGVRPGLLYMDPEEVLTRLSDFGYKPTLTALTDSGQMELPLDVEPPALAAVT